MAQKSHGIQQLLGAEKKAADLVGDARKRKTKRLKQAKEEAISEIEQFRNERETIFKETQQNRFGQDDYQKQITEDTNSKLMLIERQVKENKGAVVKRILELVYDISPKLHENFRI
ncbi:V-type proton ATPase subunit G [Hydra vulgaris]|uniref:V-type proton ATPase subunit G n=1 Tax=Hydra vulgaris TaxID=6087 RepID=UPI000192742A|nr:V-type proton ATPase subunit G [Hydra vulgaris]